MANASALIAVLRNFYCVPTAIHSQLWAKLFVQIAARRSALFQNPTNRQHWFQLKNSRIFG